MLEVGKIINTHGLRGEVKVVAWTDVPEDFENIKKVTTKKGGETVALTVGKIKYQKNNLIVKFKEIDTIDEAELYKNCILSAEKSSLPPLPEGVYYIADLIGCSVFDAQDKLVGEVTDVFSAGAGNVYEVKQENGKKLYLPANEGTVVNTDIVNKKIVMNIPEGLED
ncbi:MAG: 16S rRNA processing protein RimM [Clostridia bacterium]|nr:16S rRNA processing protein RimM [Clostridia bacterium]